jgi:hypothetical protein
MPDLPLENCHPETEDTPAANSSEAESPNSDMAHEATRQRIRRLPPEVGAVFLAVGVVGVILPGPIGAPFLLAGGLVLMPGVFGKFERWAKKRMPTIHDVGMRNVDRFIDSFEKRFPPEAAPDEPQV